MCRSSTVERRERHDGGPVRASLSEEDRGLGLTLEMYLMHQLQFSGDRSWAGVGPTANAICCRPEDGSI